jgi:hypothetical protein
MAQLLAYHRPESHKTLVFLGVILCQLLDGLASVVYVAEYSASTELGEGGPLFSLLYRDV